MKQFDKINGCNIKFFYFLFAELKIFKGKASLYKYGYHVLLRRVKKMNSEMKILKSEVERLKRLVQMHEDICFYI